MSEEEIWQKYVKPYLLKLGFPEELISGYGKVPIRTSPFGVYYADGICYIMRGGERKPYEKRAGKSKKEKSYRGHTKWGC